MYRIVELPQTTWSPAIPAEESRRLAGELEPVSYTHLTLPTNREV